MASSEQIFALASLFAIRLRYSLSRHQCPIVEIEQDRGIILFAGLEWKVRARMVLGGDGAQAQRSDIVTSRHVGLGEHFRPGEYGRAGKQRRHVPPAVDRRDVEGI